MSARKIGFDASSILYALGAVLVVYLLYLNDRQPGPFGYADAAIVTMHGKLVHAIEPGPRRSLVAEYMFEETETGRLKKLDALFIDDSIKFSRDKGKIFELSTLKNEILSCSLNGQQLCVARCVSAAACEARVVNLALARQNRTWWDLINCLILLGFFYARRIWKNRSLHPAPPDA